MSNDKVFNLRAMLEAERAENIKWNGEARFSLSNINDVASRHKHKAAAVYFAIASVFLIVAVRTIGVYYLT